MTRSYSRFLSSRWPQELSIQDQFFSPSLVLEVFTPLITKARCAKINEVVPKRNLSLVPVLENIYDRGNISAVMRSAEAFGFFEIHIIETSLQFKESARVTQGADKWLNIYKWPTTSECLDFLKKQGRQIYATHLSKQAIEIKDISHQEKSSVALILGNEKDGVSAEALSFCDGNVLIPMQGFTQSFNISVAAALCFQEASKKVQPIDAQQALALKAIYTLKSLDLNESQLNKILQSKV